ncbi:hypothetical protein U9M48_013275 [Paspalum notatum var. saurae]|uniref:Retrotransposon gag domain-containing protein n=1 Tax=Paspalum notatum var. saurae TaxID=547442 RepID=A0AAQ3SZN6_PASNO
MGEAYVGMPEMVTPPETSTQGDSFLLSWLLWSLSKVKSSTCLFKSNNGAIRKRSVTLNLWHYNHQYSPLPRIPWMLMTGFGSLSPSSIYARLTEQQKARFAAQCLHGPSGAWCVSFLAMQPAGHQVSWDEFRVAFRAHYLPPSLIELKQWEFRALQQGDMSVLEYMQAFIRLSQYSPEDVGTDPRRAARLLEGFDPTLLTHLGRRYDSFHRIGRRRHRHGASPQSGPRGSAEEKTCKHTSVGFILAATGRASPTAAHLLR